jgi:hypothetical protein
MSVSRVLSLLLASGLLASYQHVYTHGWCLHESDERAWIRLTSPPPNAEQLWILATASAPYFTFKRELWFALPTGEITLCRLGENTSPLNSRSGASWTFTLDGRLDTDVEPSMRVTGR